MGQSPETAASAAASVGDSPAASDGVTAASTAVPVGDSPAASDGGGSAALNAPASRPESEILNDLAKARRLASDLDALTARLKTGRSKAESDIIDMILSDTKTGQDIKNENKGKFQLVWGNAQSVLQSGAFYFFAGLGLLFFSIHASETQLHPSITFLLAMLGVAVLLFGTGSQSAGTIGNTVQGVGSSKDSANAPNNSMSPIVVHAAVAGGAAVLTIIFGFGVIYFSDKISGVFSDYDKYWSITITPCKSLVPSCNTDTSDVDVTGTAIVSPLRLSDYQFRITNANGQPIYLAQDNDALRLVVFKSDLAGAGFVKLSANHLDSSPVNVAGGLIGDASSNATNVKDYEEQFDIELFVDKPSDTQSSVGTTTPPCREYIRSFKVACRLSAEEIHMESRADRFGRVQYKLNFGKLTGTVYANRKGTSIEAK